MRYREGDFVESTEGLIFDVKGLVHPSERIIAFIRYFPSPEGNRIRDGIRYRRIYDLEERFAFLRRHFPQYLVYDPVFGQTLIEVPKTHLAHHYQPRSRLAEFRAASALNLLERKAFEFSDFIVDAADISRNAIGVSGSLLVGLSSPSSDLDLIVYGEENALKVNNALRQHLETATRLTKYDLETLRELHRNRCRESGVFFEKYVFHERRKFFQGHFDGTEFFVRYVKDWGEFDATYGRETYVPLERVKIYGLVVNASEALFTPCFYDLDEVEVVGDTVEPVSTITSFRGRFCQQAKVGERVVACGQLEKVFCDREISYRLVLGNHPADFMVVVQ